LSAIYAIARLWSSLVRQVKFFLGIVGANFDKIKALVFAGLATTKHLTVFLATVSRASPCSLKIFPFLYNKSFLSYPFYLGNPPMNTTTSASLKITFGSVPYSTFKTCL